ncbi:MAG: hypothetical protein WAZ14_02635 [Patescibacteria group bacterium]
MKCHPRDHWRPELQLAVHRCVAYADEKGFGLSYSSALAERPYISEVRVYGVRSHVSPWCFFCHDVHLQLAGANIQVINEVNWAMGGRGVGTDMMPIPGGQRTHLALSLSVVT